MTIKLEIKNQGPLELEANAKPVKNSGKYKR